MMLTITYCQCCRMAIAHYYNDFRLSLKYRMERILRHRCFLQERIDPDHGLLIKLQTFSLPSADVVTIKSNSSFIERNNKMIDVILQKQDYVKIFLRALSETEQQHLVNYLKADGGTMRWICLVCDSSAQDQS